ncbi:hypothetical protein Defa_13140 [Desulfovibrio sp. TH_2024_36128]|uniref:Uncharacterized protein n=1 Tax=Desulfovibrio falkowii TaxID=3136602 RepID=A0ABQ0E845_9BACT
MRRFRPYIHNRGQPPVRTVPGHSHGTAASGKHGCGHILGKTPNSYHIPGVRTPSPNLGRQAVLGYKRGRSRYGKTLFL